MLSKLFVQNTMSGRRYFSRADILKGLNRDKVSRKTFIKKELTENPEFFKAYPHLQGIFNAKDDKSTSAMQSEDALKDQVYYNHDVVTDFKDPSGRSKEGYYQSLLNQHNQYMMP